MSSRGDDLPATTMDGVSMKSNIVQIEADTAHVFVAQNFLLGSPLEAGNTGVLDFIEILNSLGAVNEDVGSQGLGAEAPDLPGLSDVVVVLVGEVTGSGLQLVPGGHLAVVDILSKTVGHGDGPHEQPVVLVGRLRQTHLVGLLRDRLPVGHNRVGLLQGNLGVIFLQVLQTDLQMELSGASNDVLSRLLNDALHHGIGLGETLQSLHQLGEISRVLGLHSDSDDRGDGELHHLHVVSFLEGGEGSGLHQELVNTDQAADVTSGDILNGLGTSSHHEDGSLDGFLEEILLLARDVVGSHDPALLSSGDLASKHTTEGVESALVRGGVESQALMAVQARSSGGPSYSSSAPYFWAVTGEGKWMTIIWNMASPAGSQFLITHFIRGFPSNSFSSVLSTSLTSLPLAVVSLPSSFSVCSFLKFMMASKTM